MCVLKGLSRTAESLDGWDGDSALSFISIIYPGFRCINYLISRFGFWLCGPHILFLHSACPDPDGCFIYSLCWLICIIPGHTEEKKKHKPTFWAHWQEQTSILELLQVFWFSGDLPGQFYSIALTPTEYLWQSCYPFKFHLGSKAQHALLLGSSKFFGISIISLILGLFWDLYVGLGFGDPF